MNPDFPLHGSAADAAFRQRARGRSQARGQVFGREPHQAVSGDAPGDQLAGLAVPAAGAVFGRRHGPGGQRELPCESEEALATAITHWCNFATALRREVAKALWEVRVGDREIKHDYRNDRYDPAA